jgi:hypothetical protein
VSSKTYLVVWDEVKDNVLDISNQLKNANLDFLVFDVCTSPTEIENSVLAAKVRYYGHFYNSLLDFCYTDHDTFIFNAGDPRFDRFGDFTKKTETFFAEPNVWAFAPNFTHDYFNGDMSKIIESKFNKDVYLSTQTNAIWVAIHRDLAIKLLDFMHWMLESGKLDFSKMVSGWGLDYIICCWSIYEGKKVYRDWSTTMLHPVGSSYSGGEEDMKIMIDSYYEYCFTNGMDVTKIKSIISTAKSKAASGRLLDLKISDVYINKEFSWD